MSTWLCYFGNLDLDSNLLPVLARFVCSVCESESVSCSVTSNSLQPHGLSIAFSRQKYWSGLLFPSPGHLPHLGDLTWVSHIEGDSWLSELSGKLEFINLELYKDHKICWHWSYFSGIRKILYINRSFALYFFFPCNKLKGFWYSPHLFSELIS